MSLKRLPAALLAIALIVTACGGGDDSESGSDDGATESTQGGSGSNNGDGGSQSGGSSSIADDARADAVGAGPDFPVPIPGGWELDQLAELVKEGASGFEGGVGLEYAGDDYDAVVSFYDDWYADLPDQSEWVRSEGQGSVIYQRSSPLIQIAVNGNFEGSLDNDGPITFLSISAPSE